MALIHFIIVIAVTYCTSTCNAKASIDDIRSELDNPILKWEAPMEIQRHYTYYLSGFDGDGRPIWVAEVGKWDLRRVVEKGGEFKDDFDKYIDQSLVRFNNSVIEANKAGRPVREFVVIFDLDEYNMYQFSSVPTIQYVMQLSGKFDRAVHSTLLRGYLVNGNFLAETVFNLAKPFLGQTVSRLDMYGTNSARWKPILLKNIPKSQLQAWYGGTALPENIVKAYG